MGACTIVGSPTVGPSGHADENLSHGEISPSASYATGGDTIDPAILGLATLDRIVISAVPRLVAATAQSAIVLGVIREGMPQRSATYGGTGTVKLQVFSALNTEASGDLSIYAFSYVAYGT